MKYVLHALILAALVFSSTHAQVKIGLMGGMNISTASQRQLFFSTPDYTPGMMLGGIVDFRLTKHISLCIEPLYIEKGSNQGGGFLIGNLSPHVSLNLSYLEIPVLFKFSTGRTLRPYIVAGPAIGFNLSSELSVGAFGFEVGIDAGDYSKPVEFSFDVGAGLSYEADELITFFIEAKYGFGINDVVKHGKVGFDLADIHELFTIPKSTKYNNRGIQLTIGFMLPLSDD